MEQLVIGESLKVRVVLHGDNIGRVFSTSWEGSPGAIGTLDIFEAVHGRANRVAWRLERLSTIG